MPHGHPRWRRVHGELSQASAAPHSSEDSSIRPSVTRRSALTISCSPIADAGGVPWWWPPTALGSLCCAPIAVGFPAMGKREGVLGSYLYTGKAGNHNNFIPQLASEDPRFAVNSVAMGKKVLVPGSTCQRLRRGRV